MESQRSDTANKKDINSNADKLKETEKEVDKTEDEKLNDSKAKHAMLHGSKVKGGIKTEKLDNKKAGCCCTIF